MTTFLLGDIIPDQYLFELQTQTGIAVFYKLFKIINSLTSYTQL